jgi:hypothetical protein
MAIFFTVAAFLMLVLDRSFQTNESTNVVSIVSQDDDADDGISGIA